MTPTAAKWTCLLSAVTLTVSLGCAPVPSRETLESEMLEADRAFLQATVDDGLEGWLSFFTEDAARVDLQGQTAVGLDAIRVADAPLFEPGGLRLRWEPTEAIAFAGNSNGMTRGRYKLISETEPTEVLGEGTYLTLWRREDGRLKVYLDTGAPDPPPEALLD
jgi:ketosteroid isomerase-like protein